MVVRGAVIHIISMLLASMLLTVPPVPAAGAPVVALPVLTGFVAGSGADFPAMRRSGARAVKLMADWSAIEPDRGTFHWQELDAAVSAATRAGLAVTLVLAYTPKWASLATGVELRDPAIWSRQPPKRPADWEHFVEAIAARYKGRVRDWQVWTVLSLPIWRGTAREYFALVTAAKAATKAADPGSRVILATPHGADLVSIRRALLEIPDAFDAISLNPRGLAPEALLRPLGTLRERVLPRSPKRLRIEWDPRASGERPSWSAQIVKVLAIAAAFNVERVDLAVDPAIASGALEMVSSTVGGQPFTGYLQQGRALAFVFGEGAPSAIAWSGAGETPLALEGEGLTAITPAGDTRAVTAEGGRSTVTVGTQPVLIKGLAASASSVARDAMAADASPVFAGTREFSRATEVSARLGKANVEEGLYNMLFRERRNGAVQAVQVGGSEAVRTDVGKDVVYVYFDVDDSFMYYVDGRYAVEVSIEVYGASAPEQLGFNLFYDSMTDLRFTRWQVVEAKDGWVTQSIRLLDAAFANTWGWDFAINAAGNRGEDLTVRSVIVRKITR